MPLGPHPSEMPEWNAAWVLYQTGKYDGYVQNFKMACEKWEASARLAGVKPPRMFTMAKFASAIATPTVLREMLSAASTQQAQENIVRAAGEKRRGNSKDQAKAIRVGSGQRAGSDPDVRCGPENFEFINQEPGPEEENGQPATKQPKQKKSF
ncbi:hypothetical protein EG327_010939 [Venturia inaequalis]|uniref:Uncharacterized protein n=1 Tax=Venturia inaequalis TaxID=5025 RepID=A0A8H3UG08_VENIN|nr:hypothetical protein EG327_010939 [Venturia inaequalis]